ncbi:hypothetical protein BMF89_00300 [Arthrobacter sp. SRS-W-1-2016]|nr:hypothetical protein BMF89_00300 [Arthrobacter sp. SRS-W-1-2016]
MANERQLLLQVRARPLLFATFVSGVVSDLLRSLPTEDPWRHTALVRGTVLSVRGDWFGTRVDATDCQRQLRNDRARYVGLPVGGK